MEQSTPAKSEANTTDPRAAHSGERPRQNTEGAEPAYPNQANERNGKGSPYGGTQSPDAASPDGNQTPKTSENASPDETRTPGDLGSEYANPDSYGTGATDHYGGSQPDEADTDAAGTPVR